jgi:hypothetical protein
MNPPGDAKVTDDAGVVAPDASSSEPQEVRQAEEDTMTTVIKKLRNNFIGNLIGN